MTDTWTRYLVPLYAIDGGMRNHCGEKAWNLAEALRHGHPVPPAVCIHSKLLPELLQFAGTYSKLTRYADEGLNRTAYITALILDTAWPQALLQSMLDTLRPIGDLFAVRSSSLYEDRPGQSRAGCYHSLLHVPREAGALQRAVQTCWASAFSPLTLAWNRNIDPGTMPVLVQRLVEAAVSGVCFSREPERPESGLLVAEVVTGTSQRLVAGEQPVQRLTFRRADRQLLTRNEAMLSAQAQRSLVDLALRLETEYGGPVDLEWAIDRDHVLWLLQVRPLAVLQPQPRSDFFGHPVVVRLEDEIAALGSVSGPVLPVLEARMDKRRYVYRAAQRIGVDYRREGFFIPNRGALTTQGLHHALSWIRTDVVEIATAAGKFECRHRTDLVPWMLAYSANPPHRYDSIYISEFHANEVTGFASLLANDRVLIEYIPGGFGGFLSGDLAFSRVELDVDGKVVKQQLEICDRAWYWSPAEMSMRPVALPPSPVSLDPADIDQIRRMTLSMSTAFGQVRLEWIKTRERLLIWDLSIETATLIGESESQVLSPGEARGPAFIIDNFREMERVAPDRGVIADPEFYAAYYSPAGRALRERLRESTGPPIIVAPYPRTSLAVYLGEAAGFVFDAGATLCHLGIILRESRVPGVFWPNATKRLRTGEWIELRDGRVQRESERYHGQPCPEEL
jgi:rifampicin phosphotransferase